MVFNEPYRAVPMRSTVPARPVDAPGRLTDEWRTAAAWQQVAAKALGPPALPDLTSEIAFVTERHWGYTRQLDGSTLEYEVAHPVWRVWSATAPVLAADLAGLYGRALASALSRPPSSTLIAEGSAVSVYSPSRIGDTGRRPS